MKFETHYSRTPAPPEINTGEKLVETAGYMTAQQRIEAIMNAGQRLESWRKEQFDFSDKIDENFFDPTRRKNYDLADAFQDKLSADANLAQAKAEADDLLKSSQAAQKASGEAEKEKQG